jgi:CRISPR-associated protein (TIGR02584 family)
MRHERRKSKPRQELKVAEVDRDKAKSEDTVSSGQIVLLSVTGQSPAVLTETVWALAQERPAIIPHRVVVITTTEGRNTLVKELLSPVDNCVWDQLRARLEGLGHDLTDRLQFGATPHDIRVFTIFDPKLKRTRELEDIGSEAENAAAADFIMETVRGLAMDDGVRLVASIAGGRKTMSALLFSVMSLLGKEDDLLTHILINEPFESRGLKPRFYFPPAEAVMHQGMDREGTHISISSVKAKVQLGKIPFVALRNLFERDLKKKQSYSRLVQTCQKTANEYARQNVHLTVYRSKTLIAVNGKQIATSAREHLYMLFLAERVHAKQPRLPSYAAAFDDFNQFCKETYASRRPDDFADWRHEAEIKLSIEEMERFCVKAKNQLKEKLSAQDAVQLLEVLPKAKQFFLDLPPSSIDIKD